jgi:hypothetical protein
MRGWEARNGGVRGSGERELWLPGAGMQGERKSAEGGVRALSGRLLHLK